MKIFLPFVFVLIIFNSPFAQSEEKISTLINLLYKVEDFNIRLSNVLINNKDFEANSKDKYFMQVIGSIVEESALTTYVQSIQTSIQHNFTATEIDSLIEVLNSPYGEVIQNAFMLDNQIIEANLQRYAVMIVTDALDKQTERDSFLFEKDYPIDLRDIMIGEYNYDTPDWGEIKVVREQNKQTMLIQESQLDYTVEWLSNSKYKLSLQTSHPLFADNDTITVNIYSTDGKTFKSIYKYQNSFYKDELTKVKFNSYSDEIKLFQAELNNNYRNPYTTPLSYEQLINFTTHSFYPVEEKYRVNADLELFSEPEIVEFATSSGQPVAYLRYGTANFQLNSKKQQLTVFKSTREDEPENRLFIPFTDATSGEATYGGGRYVETDFNENDKTIVIDFNQAYQPYCVYSDNYSCPIPPVENALEVKITAGVRL